METTSSPWIWISLAFHPGYHYDAFAATSNEILSIYFCFNQLNYYLFQTSKVGTVTFYEARPGSFVYYEHNFHVMDLKVQIPLNHSYYPLLIIRFASVSARTWYLEMWTRYLPADSKCHAVIGIPLWSFTRQSWVKRWMITQK